MSSLPIKILPLKQGKKLAVTIILGPYLSTLIINIGEVINSEEVGRLWKC